MPLGIGIVSSWCHVDLGDRNWGQEAGWGTGGRLRGQGCDPGVEAEWMQEGKGHILVRRAGVLRQPLRWGWVHRDCYVIWEPEACWISTSFFLSFGWEDFFKSTMNFTSQLTRFPGLLCCLEFWLSSVVQSRVLSPSPGVTSSPIGVIFQCPLSQQARILLFRRKKIEKWSLFLNTYLALAHIRYQACSKWFSNINS